MTENIKEALQYAVALAGNEEKIIKDQFGIEWYDSNKFNLHELKEYRYYPESLKLNTLSSLVAYIKSGLNSLLEQNLIIVVQDPENVVVLTENDDREKATKLVQVNASIPEIYFEKHYDAESFNIILQSRFTAKNDRDLLLEYASKIVIENGADIEDDGVSQVTTVKQGVASKAKAKAPNPVTLAPYRTFTEVEQPSSDFVFRINQNGHLALFEADGGAWKLEAMNNVANYLKEELSELENILVLA